MSSVLFVLQIKKEYEQVSTAKAAPYFRTAALYKYTALPLLQCQTTSV